MAGGPAAAPFSRDGALRTQNRGARSTQASSLADSQGRGAGSRGTRPADHGRDFDAQGRTGGQGLVGQRRAGRDRRRRRRDRCRPRGVDRPAGRLEDGPRAARRVRRTDADLLARLARLLGVFLLGLADLRRPLVARNLDLLVLLSFGVSLAFFNRGSVFRASALAVPPLLYLLGACAGSASLAPVRAAARPVWPVWVLAGATLFLVGFRIGLNVQTPRSVIDVGYAGVIGARPHPRRGGAVRAHAAAGRLKPCGPADADGSSAIASRRTAAASRRTRAATRTGRSPTRLRPGGRGVRLEREVGRAARGARDVDRARPLVAARARARRAAARRTPAGATLAFAWAAYPFTAYALAREHERRADARAARRGGSGSRPRPRRGGGVALAGWTKFAVAAARRRSGSPTPHGLVHRGARRALRGRRSSLATRRRFSVLLLEPDLSTRQDVLGSDARLPARARVAVLALGLGAVPRRGDPRPRLAQRAVQVARARSRRGRGRRPAPQGPARARRADAGDPARGPALADPLVLPLPSVGAAVRRARAPPAARPDAART